MIEQPEIEKVNLAEARELALSHDRATADYLKRFYNIKLRKVSLYSSQEGGSTYVENKRD
jgi:hypothetical protein